MRWSLLILLLISPVWAADFYVSNNGDDAANGSTEKSAWKTLARVEKEDLQPGDIVHLDGRSTWHESLRLTHSGTRDKTITIQGEISTNGHEDHLATISGVDDQGKSTGEYGIDVAASHVRIWGVAFQSAGNPKRGAVMIWADQDRENIKIDHCLFEASRGRGIWVAGDSGKNVSELTIRRNFFRDNDGSPIQITKMKNGQIADNVFRGNCRKIVDPWQAAIRLWSGDICDVVVSGNRIENQKFNLDKSQGMGIHIDEVGPGVVVKNNEIKGSDTIGILVENTQGVQVANNTIEDVDTGIFCYRAGHDHQIIRNTIHARSLGIVLQGHRANGVDAGPEIVKNELLFTKNRIEHNISMTDQNAVLKIIGGAEKRAAQAEANVIDSNYFGPDRKYQFEWGDRFLSSTRELDGLAGPTHSVALPDDGDLSKIDAGAKR